MAREHKATCMVLAICGVAALTPLWAADAAQAMHWSDVPAKAITLFHPGQASWEWALTQSDHSGAKKFRGGKACGQCHDGEESAIGKVIASGKKVEPAPPAGRPGSIELRVQAVHDGQRLYLRLEWPAVDAKGATRCNASSPLYARTTSNPAGARNFSIRTTFSLRSSTTRIFGLVSALLIDSVPHLETPDAATGPKSGVARPPRTR